MRCPVCGKHVAEERYELHVGRHTDIAPESEDTTADEESVPASVGASVGAAPQGAETMRSRPVAAAVDAGALLLGPQGDAAPIAADADGEPAADEPPADEEPAADQAIDEEPAGEDHGGEEPAGEEPAGEEPIDGDADHGALTVDEEPGDEEATTGVPDDAPPDDAPPDDAPPVDADDDTVVDGEFEPTTPLVLEPTAPVEVEADAAGWGTPAPAGGQRLAPFPAAPVSQRRSTLPLLGLVALVAITAVIAFALSNDDDDKPASVRAATPSTAVTFPSLVPSPTATTAPPAATPAPSLAPAVIPPVPPGGGLTTPPPGAGAGAATGAGQIQIQPTRADCEGGRMVVDGTVANNAGGRYNVTFSVTVTSASGQPLGTARATVAGLGPSERRTFQAVGACSGDLGPGNRAVPQVEGITPA